MEIQFTQEELDQIQEVQKKILKELSTIDNDNLKTAEYNDDIA